MLATVHVLDVEVFGCWMVDQRICIAPASYSVAPVYALWLMGRI